MARHLLKRVRELWAEEIDDESVADGSVDSADLISVYKELLGMRKQDVDDEVILGVIEESAAGVAKRRRTAADVFLMIAGREAGDAELDTLETLTDVAEIAARVKGMMVGAGRPMAREIAQDLDLAEQELAEQESEDEEDSVTAPLVDEGWIETFGETYGREPFVHEYMYLRGGMYGPLDDTVLVYDDTLVSMREVYSNYLNEQLEEGKFVRLYVPVMYTDAELVRKVVLDVTDGEGYAEAMKERLSHLYKVLFGDALTDADAGYVFEKWVRGDRLSLTCDLNQIIVGFKDEADAHAADMADLWDSVLGRAPLEREISRHKQAYRIDTKDARRDAHAELVKSREFTHVITAQIQERFPEMPAFDVYELLDKVLLQFDLVTTPVGVCIDTLSARAC